MSWQQHHCWSVRCDICGDGWTAYDAQPHFDQRDELLTYAAVAGWVITDLRAVCAGCTPEEACAVTGHSWARWRPAGPYPRPDGSTWVGRVRHCINCSAGEWDPPAAAGG